MDTGITFDWGNLFGSVMTGLEQAIQAVLPLGLSIFGIMLAVSLGMKVFKKFTGR